MKKRLFLFWINLCVSCLAFGRSGPHAVNDTVFVPQNKIGYIISVIIGNDGDSTGGTLSAAVISSPAHGGVSIINGNQFSYTPKGYYYGPDSFTYSVCDTVPLCDTAVVYINVVGHDYPPVALLDTFTFADSVDTVILNVLANDYDPENFSFSVTSVINIDTLRTDSIKLDSSTGQVLFIRSPYSCGMDSFEYVICDTLGACDTGTIIITINCPDNVFLPQGISPNGDGLNDKLVFTGLGYFSPASLQVFNRYGNTVYQSNNYQNDWQGTNRDSNGEALPDGTYFYILVLSNHHKYENYLIINR